MNIAINKIFSSPSDKNYFFGYYDKLQFNENSGKLLAIEVPFKNRMPSIEDIVKIGYFDVRSLGQFVVLDETNCFNWQQGNMLSWLNDNCIIYNKFLDGSYVTCIFNVDTQEKTHIEGGHYTFSKDGLVLIDFERHYWYRNGYSYSNIINEEKRIPVDFNESVWFYDFISSKKILLFNLKRLLVEIPVPSKYLEGIVYMEHFMFSPDGKNLAFLLRFKSESQLITYFIVFNMETEEFLLLNDKLHRFTHYSWINNFEVIAWCGGDTSFNYFRGIISNFKFLKKFALQIYKGIMTSNSVSGNSKLSSFVTGDAYHRIKINGSVNKIHSVLLNRDGHPTVEKLFNRFLLSDTYPDLSGVQKCFIYDLDKNIAHDFFNLDSDISIMNTPYRCDFHPRWSSDFNYISLDYATVNNRGIVLFQITYV